MPQIPDTRSAIVAHRQLSRCSLATSLVFEGCYGYRSTIASATCRILKGQVEIVPLIRGLSDSMKGDEHAEFKITECLWSANGAILENFIPNLINAKGPFFCQFVIEQ